MQFSEIEAGQIYFCHKISKTKVTFVVAQEDFQLRTLEGLQDVKAGQIVITAMTGESWAIDAEKFEKMYEKTSRNEAISIPSKRMVAKAIPTSVGQKVIYKQDVYEFKGNEFVVYYGKDDCGIVQENEFIGTYEIEELADPFSVITFWKEAGSYFKKVDE